MKKYSLVILLIMFSCFKTSASELKINNLGDLKKLGENLIKKETSIEIRDEKKEDTQQDKVETPKEEEKKVKKENVKENNTTSTLSLMNKEELMQNLDRKRVVVKAMNTQSKIVFLFDLKNEYLKYIICSGGRMTCEEAWKVKLIKLEDLYNLMNFNIDENLKTKNLINSYIISYRGETDIDETNFSRPQTGRDQEIAEKYGIKNSFLSPNGGINLLNQIENKKPSYGFIISGWSMNKKKELVKITSKNHNETPSIEEYETLSISDFNSTDIACIEGKKECINIQEEF